MNNIAPVDYFLEGRKREYQVSGRFSSIEDAVASGAELLKNGYHIIHFKDEDGVYQYVATKGQHND
jgi:hypothetical protein